MACGLYCCWPLGAFSSWFLVLVSRLCFLFCLLFCFVYVLCFVLFCLCFMFCFVYCFVYVLFCLLFCLCLVLSKFVYVLFCLCFMICLCFVLFCVVFEAILSSSILLPHCMPSSSLSLSCLFPLYLTFPLLRMALK